MSCRSIPKCVFISPDSNAGNWAVISQRKSLLSFQGHRPKVGGKIFLAEGARVIGRVTMGKGANVWFNAVLRGDVETLEIGEYTNIQDGAVLHADPGFPVKLGRHVTVGHQAILHGCEIGDETLVGMGAIIMNGVKIGRQCLIGAGSLITEKFSAPDGSLIYGSPAKIIRPLNRTERAQLKPHAQHYHELAQKYGRI
jgi:carbonic anhydrase/acetyltransferase-like protein (isoleucine patch superfamily)